jgi:folate-binding Fe-S cluster repair protein YgfZ
MHYRGLAKRRFFPVRIEGRVLGLGAILNFGDEEVGELRSQSGHLGLALLKIEAVQQSIAAQRPLTNAETKLYPSIPTWMKFDAPAANS